MIIFCFVLIFVHATTFLWTKRKCKGKSPMISEWIITGRFLIELIFYRFSLQETTGQSLISPGFALILIQKTENKNHRKEGFRSYIIFATNSKQIPDETARRCIYLRVNISLSKHISLSIAESYKDWLKNITSEQKYFKTTYLSRFGFAKIPKPFACKHYKTSWLFL